MEKTWCATQLKVNKHDICACPHEWTEFLRCYALIETLFWVVFRLMRVGRSEGSSSSALALALELVRATSTRVSVLVISCPDELVLFGMSTITQY